MPAVRHEGDKEETGWIDTDIHKVRCHRRKRHRSNWAAEWARPSAAVMSSGKAGFASTLTEVYASAKDATTSEVSAA